MSSLVNKPLTSLCAAGNPELRTPDLFIGQSCRIVARKSGNNFRISGSSVPSRKSRCNDNGIVCRAVSVEPETEIEGLNIAEDVTQVRQYISIYLCFYVNNLNKCALIE